MFDEQCFGFISGVEKAFSFNRHHGVSVSIHLKGFFQFGHFDFDDSQQIFRNSPQGEEERSEGNGAEVVAQQRADGARHRKHDALVVAPEEVVDDDAGDDDVLAVENKLGEPEEAEDVKPPGTPQRRVAFAIDEAGGGVDARVPGGGERKQAN